MLPGHSQLHGIQQHELYNSICNSRLRASKRRTSSRLQHAKKRESQAGDEAVHYFVLKSQLSEAILRPFPACASRIQVRTGGTCGTGICRNRGASLAGRRFPALIQDP